MADQAKGTDTPQPRKKKSLFNKPVWSQPDKSTDPIALFSRANELWPVRVVEEEAERKEKLDAKKRPSDGGESSDRGGKRRGIVKSDSESGLPDHSQINSDSDEASTFPRYVN